MKNKSIIFEIVFLQTLGPILVVIGHSMNGLPENEFFQYIKSFIYVFHMPLFFFISGLLFSYCYKDKNISYKEYIMKKAYKLLIPYFFWNFIFILPKYLIQSFLVDSFDLSLKNLLLMIITPRLMIWGHTWFLVAIFIVYYLAPFLKKIFLDFKILFYILLALTILLSCFPINNDILTMADLSKDFCFFIIGFTIFQFRYVLTERKNIVLFTLLFVISFILWNTLNFRAIEVLLCFSVLVLLLTIGVYLKTKIRSNIISDNSMTFYLFHWPFMIITRILLFQLLHLNYILVVLFMLISGVLGPIIMIKIIDYTKIKQKSKFIKTIIGG